MALRYLSPIHKASRQIAIYFEEPCARFDLNTQEGHVLSYLAEYGPCPVSEIHRVVGVKRSTLSSLLDRLEKRELLRRVAHPTDRRSLQIEIEPEGRAIAKDLRTAVEALEEKLDQRIGEDVARGFFAVLEALTELTQVEVRPSDAAQISVPTPPSEDSNHHSPKSDM